MSDVAARMGRMSLAAESGYTAEEVEAVLAVRNALLERGVPRDALQEVPLITVTLVAKCRVEEAVTKFMTYREDLLAAYGVTDVFSPAAEKALAEQWHRLAVAGVDEEGRQIMWIHGGGTQPDGLPQRTIRWSHKGIVASASTASETTPLRRPGEPPQTRPWYAGSGRAAKKGKGAVVKPGGA